MHLLFPGRHLVNTRFQEEYLLQVLQTPLARLSFLGPPPAGHAGAAFDSVLFAVTSANRQNSRYNPIPFHVRVIGVDRFARSLRETLGVRYRIHGIPHFPPTARFAQNVLKEFEEQTEGALELTPANTAVLCSTPAVAAQFTALGFAVLPCELGEPADKRPRGPYDLVKRVAELGDAWTTDGELRRVLAAATFSLWSDFPDVPRRIVRLHRDPLLNEEGDLTATRDYATYAFAMSNPAVIEFKYKDVAEAIVEGKIVDEGCADGALLVPIARDFPDSDLIGIEITGEFLAQCYERQRRGDFGGTYIYFHQRNLMEEIFEPESIDTTLCNSTTHEIWSYGAGEATLRPYLERKFRQTRPGGRLIIRDVVGPEDPDREVWLWCRDDDADKSSAGRAADIHQAFPTSGELQKHLASLSTADRFRRFARDFLAAERSSGRRGAESEVRYREETDNNRTHFVLKLKDAAEFLSKKDYLDNWSSELHEEFTFWSFSRWKEALVAAGFSIIENPAEPLAGSRAYLNPWIVDNRYRGKVELFARTAEGLAPLEFPPTNMVLVGERRNVSLRTPPPNAGARVESRSPGH